MSDNTFHIDFKLFIYWFHSNFLNRLIQLFFQIAAVKPQKKLFSGKSTFETPSLTLFLFNKLAVTKHTSTSNE